MFKGWGLVYLGVFLVGISLTVIILEWRAVADIAKVAHGHGLLTGRHALLAQVVSEGAASSRSDALLEAQADGKVGAALGGGDSKSLRGNPGLRAELEKTLRVAEAAAHSAPVGAQTAVQRLVGQRPEFTGTFPPFPTPREVRHPKCFRSFDLSKLPRVSLVIPYLHETIEQITMTVGSLLADGPLELIDQILFIDDGNDKAWEFHPQLLALHPKVKIHRNEQRQGLIKAKVTGAALVTSPVIVFMEPHCVVQKQWLEPLLEQLAMSKDHNMLVMPTLDIIPEANFNEYHPANHHIGGFDWSLTFNWMALVEHRNKSYHYPDPYPTPALSGGIFGIWKDYWERMGTYDTNMTEWGGEHIEMSLRIWRCGGRIEIVPCSRMGHVFRAKNPYKVHPVEVVRNTKRAALVWLDEHLEDFYSKVPFARSLEAGDVSDRLRLKESLHCKSIDWYIDSVYPELREKALQKR
mmetsp:Transcript_103630/g.186984  ORF Transcript_103630/g.186984 Transcript_103630/m.186984 type:complete len:465 (-) Transcript_103630:117-1511(-)